MSDRWNGIGEPDDIEPRPDLNEEALRADIENDAAAVTRVAIPSDQVRTVIECGQQLSEEPS